MDYNYASTSANARASAFNWRRRSSEPRETRARHILDMNNIELRKFMRSFDIVITEIVGVIWWLDEDMPRAGHAIMQLKEHGKQVRFLTNYGGCTVDQFLRRLTRIGVTGVKKSDIACPCKTLTQYLKRFMSHQPVYSLCSADTNREFYRRGVDVVFMEPNDAITIEEIERNLLEADPVAAVVLDWNMNLTYAELSMAHRFLQNDNCHFIVGSTDLYVQVTRKFKALGPGYFMNLLRESSGKEPTIWGKPARRLCEELMNYFKIADPKRVLFIGCDLTNDIDFARSCGYQTCFVSTGTSTIREMMELPENHQPDYIAGSIVEFITLLSRVNKYRFSESTQLEQPQNEEVLLPSSGKKGAVNSSSSDD